MKIKNLSDKKMNEFAGILVDKETEILSDLHELNEQLEMVKFLQSLLLDGKSKTQKK